MKSGLIKKIKYDSDQYYFMSTYSAVIQKEGNIYIAKCPEIGTVSQGNDIEEAISNLKEATELYLEEFPAKKKSKAILTTFEVALLESK